MIVAGAQVRVDTLYYATVHLPRQLNSRRASLKLTSEQENDLKITVSLIRSLSDDRGFSARTSPYATQLCTGGHSSIRIAWG